LSTAVILTDASNAGIYDLQVTHSQLHIALHTVQLVPSL
jgi:hypothetical protein